MGEPSPKILASEEKATNYLNIIELESGSSFLHPKVTLSGMSCVLVSAILPAWVSCTGERIRTCSGITNVDFQTVGLVVPALISEFSYAGHTSENAHFLLSVCRLRKVVLL